MNSLYSIEVRNILHTAPWPKGLRIDVVEYESYLGLKMYREDIIRLDGESHAQLKKTLKIVRARISGLGISTGVELA